MVAISVVADWTTITVVKIKEGISVRVATILVVVVLDADAAMAMTTGMATIFTAEIISGKMIISMESLMKIMVKRNSRMRIGWTELIGPINTASRCSTKLRKWL